MDMSVIRSRKRPRPSTSFSDWNSIIQNNFSEDNPLTSGVKDSSVAVDDSDGDGNYDFKDAQQGNITDEKDGNILLYGDAPFAVDCDLEDDDVNPFDVEIDDLGDDDGDEVVDEDLSGDDPMYYGSRTGLSLPGGYRDDESVRLKFRPDAFQSSINQAFNLDQELIPPGAHVGVKKRRTNSLPQLPLSQISYRRVSELSKIGDIKPCFVPSASSSKNQWTGSSPISSTSSGFNNMNGAAATLSCSPLSPVSSTKRRESCTDDNGYYIAEIGDYFANGRFKILSILGQGTFGKVIKALDCQTNETVAIKIVRAIPKYREASKIELRVLTTLKKADPENLNHCIHLREVLDYENHICIITDLLDISLYEFLQSNKFKPFPGSQIQAITRQLVRSVAFLHDLKLIHTDLKPENILLASADALKHRRLLVLKDPVINIIDFGSAVFDDEYHSELVSTRHYRAPEIVLGIGWSFPCDMWSLGCILVELVTGEALFNTHENLEHLAMMQKILDQKIPSHMVRRVEKQSVKDFFLKSGSTYLLHYPNAKTEQKSIDAVSKVKRLDHWICSKLKLKVKINMHESLESNWKTNVSKMADLDYEAFQFWFYFIDLVRQLLRYDPSKRITAIQAMEHPWWDFGIIDEATRSMNQENHLA